MTAARAPAALLVVVVVAAGGGCLSATRFLEVRLASTARVDVDGADAARVERSDKDVTVDGESILSDGSWHPRRPPAAVRVLDDPPAELRLRDRYVWKRGGVIAATPADNVTGAEVGTFWSQPLGIVPSMGAVVLGGICALGFGIASGADLADVAAGDPRPLGEGVGLGVASVAGAALATYGVVSWVLVSRAFWYDEIPVVVVPAAR